MRFYYTTSVLAFVSAAISEVLAQSSDAVAPRAFWRDLTFGFWSPDGREIAYINATGFNADLLRLISTTASGNFHRIESPITFIVGWHARLVTDHKKHLVGRVHGSI